MVINNRSMLGIDVLYEDIASQYEKLQILVDELKADLRAAQEKLNDLTTGIDGKITIESSDING